VDVTNTGFRSGDEVVQLYLHQRYGTSARPVRELKRFERVTIEPGETRKVAFELGDEALAYWSAATQGWVIDETMFDLYVGSDSTAELAASFEVRKPTPR
jgi:beta-glucosidase